jgi:signal transduction histidine kinase
LNLLTNASDAAGVGGQIEVEIRRQRDGVQLTVTDNGPGVPLSDRDQVFAPFFSTKIDGLGLGLALVKKFAEEAGGEVLCESNPTGRGARFRVLLPALSADQPRENGSWARVPEY